MEDKEIPDRCKKFDDIDRVINTQEAKLEALHEAAESLVDSDDEDDDVFAGDDSIGGLLDELTDRWNRLKAAMFAKRNQIMEIRTLPEFIADSDDMDVWLTEKLRVLQDEPRAAAPNIEARYQKHLAFDAEIAQNAEPLQALIRAGHHLIDSGN